MKFKNYLTEIDNVAIFPLIALVIFVTIFAIAAIYAFSADKKKMKDNANIPLN
ncbi:MAG: CcoQ/FixQ family Cbb3-type cytochrome c oxidase assembly chaperone [Sphingobacteriales bacterium]|nr:MAG: CcoQ/FixQ family Cbb3-type cytochrome c oxidase assembly chaperone [Sphingobacteriales bacterium]